MAGRASIVGAAATHVGKVREHNEDAYFLDVDLGIFLVCDGMGGHAAGEVASAIAVRSLCEEWASGSVRDVAAQWLDRGTPDAKKRLIDVVRAGVFAAHSAILAEATRDRTKHGMGTTLVGGMVIGGEAVFAHAGDSRAYLVRDGISMQLTEDHTLLARLLAAGIDVDVSGEGSRFRSMLTNALGIGDEVKVSTFVVPLADGDWFMLCSDGISEYVPENEVGEVLSKAPSPAHGADRLVELALERGGGDNATAVVIRVLEAGETPHPAEQRKKDDAVIASCALWGKKVTPQQRLRALRIAIPRDHVKGDKLPPHALGDRVAWLIVEGELMQDGLPLGPGSLVYPESLVIASAKAELPPLPDRDALAIARGEVRALAIRADDFRELCEDDSELGDALVDGLSQMISARKKARVLRPSPAVDPRGATDPQLRVVGKRDVAEAYHTTDPSMPVVDPTAPSFDGTASRGQAPSSDPAADAVPAAVDGRADDYSDGRDRAATVPDDPSVARPWLPAESPVIAPVGQAPARPSPLPGSLVKRVAPPAPGPATRPSPLPAQLSPRGSAPKPAPPAAMRVHPALMAKPLEAEAKSAPKADAKPERKSEPKIELRPVVAPAVSPAPATAAPSPLETANRTQPGDWDELTERIGPPRRMPAVVAKGFAPALSPPESAPTGTPVTLPTATRSEKPTMPVAASRQRPPTEPEIETYFELEIEADLPPAAAAAEAAQAAAAPAKFVTTSKRVTASKPSIDEQSLSAALAFGSAPRLTRDEIDDAYDAVLITVDDRGAAGGAADRPAARTADSDYDSVTVTVSEDTAVGPRPRRITADDAMTVSGTIDGPGVPRAGSAAEGRRGPIDGPGVPRAGSAAEGRRGPIDGVPPSAQPRRAKRHSGGLDD